MVVSSSKSAEDEKLEEEWLALSAEQRVLQGLQGRVNASTKSATN